MTVDISAADFASNFDIKRCTVGVVGHGYVGQAVSAFFERACRVLIHDRAKPQLQTLTDIVRNAEVIFICVPTPMRQDGQCHTAIVESVIDDIERTATEVGRPPDAFVLVIKSTVRPGFTEEMQGSHLNMRILFSPEFLTEKSSIEDFKNTNRVILGGEEEDAAIVFKYFQGVIPERVENDETVLLQCNPTVAEMAKLYTNGILATKVMFSNEMYLMSEKLGIEYDEVRFLACLDPRVGDSHTRVPGHDGHFGVGGSCFPKDINNLRYTASELGVLERIFTAVIERNNELRPEKDWEDLKGRAIVD